MDLFQHRREREKPGAPLAERMRPRALAEVVGQGDLLAEGKPLRRAIETDQVPSMILWGPPGSGKTTLAMVIAQHTEAAFEPVSAVLSGVADLRKAIAAAEERLAVYGKATILFVDEIHRFNKAQQDALLPHVERGTVVLIGATTENPSFSVNSALLSRARVYRLAELSEDAIIELLQRALQDPERGVGAKRLTANDEALRQLAAFADGDARRALSILELSAQQLSPGTALTEKAVQAALSQPTLRYDRSGDAHYDLTSAFIKSLRGSDPDAALYWMMRMIDGGEDPAFVLRRMIIFASEDIGNADHRALPLAVAADQAHQRLGMPEALMALGQCCTFLALAPKSNASYEGWKRAQQDVKEHGSLPVPEKLRNAPSQLMKEMGHGHGYRYPHDEGGFVPGENYLPAKLQGRRYYEPKPLGAEKTLLERLKQNRAASRGDDGDKSG